jgi:hypothetical protein
LGKPRSATSGVFLLLFSPNPRPQIIWLDDALYQPFISFLIKGLSMPKLLRKIFKLPFFLLGVETPETAVSPRELAELLKHAKEAKVIVEIGVFDGANTVNFAKATTGQVYAIDPFSPICRAASVAIKLRPSVD